MKILLIGIFIGVVLGYGWAWKALTPTHRAEVAYWEQRDEQWQDRHVRIRAELFNLVAQSKRGK